MTGKFHAYTVLSRQEEAVDISSFWLRPEGAVTARGGEHLIVEALVGDGSYALRREYSVSGLSDGALRLTVKRERAPKGQPTLPPGYVSSWLLDEVKQGDVLRASAPRGEFRLREGSEKPVLLFSCGVGITPMMLLAKELAGSGRRVAFVHVCRDGAHHVFGLEIRALAAQAANMSVHICYKHGTSDCAGCDSTGDLNRDRLAALLPGAGCEVYLCGPGAFMQRAYDMALDLGVKAEDIRYELFGPSSDFTPRHAPSSGTSDGPLVTFTKSGISARWSADAPSLLDFAEEQGLYPDYSCRAGSCESCKTRVVSGDFDYPVEPFERPGEGYVLLCCAQPTSDLELEV